MTTPEERNNKNASWNKATPCTKKSKTLPNVQMDPKSAQTSATDPDRSKHSVDSLRSSSYVRRAWSSSFLVMKRRSVTRPWGIVLDTKLIDFLLQVDYTIIFETYLKSCTETIPHHFLEISQYLELSFFTEVASTATLWLSCWWRAPSIRVWSSGAEQRWTGAFVDPAGGFSSRARRTVGSLCC